MQTPLTIGVAGCGIGGMAAAVYLARAGHRITIFERFETPRPLGAGLLLQPTGLDVLRDLGLLKGATACGARITRLEGRTNRGRKVMDLDYRRARADFFGLGIQRGALFQLLFDAVRAGGVDLVTATEITAVEEAERRPEFVDDAGRRHGPFDLAILADGSDSSLRSVIPAIRRDRPYPWGAVWCLCDDVDGRWDGILHQRYERARRMCGVLPVGRLPGDAGRNGRVSFFWSFPISKLALWPGDLFEGWRREVIDYWPETRSLVDQIERPGILAKATYRDVVVRAPNYGRVVAIGDSAHAMSPQLGQGANLALMDGRALAAAVQGRSVDEGVGHYARVRRRHVTTYQALSRWLTPLFQGHGRITPWLRDLVFPLASRIPPARGEAHAILTGVKEGPFRRLQIEPFDK